jgi:hypothetical protein
MTRCGVRVCVYTQIMTTNLTPTTTVKFTETLTAANGTEYRLNKESVTVAITIENETREITFTGSVDRDHLTNHHDLVCRIGHGTKAHACSANILRNADGTFTFQFSTVALNRTAKISGFASKVQECGKSQHSGSKVN